MTPWITVPPSHTWLRNARAPLSLVQGLTAPPDPEGLIPLDIELQDGTIATVAPAGTAPDGIDLKHNQVWPCLVDGHTHLDKTQTLPRAPNPSATHKGAAQAVIADLAAHYTEADVETRFAFGLACAYAHGVSIIRTHIDSYGEHARTSWRVFRRLRDAWAGRIALQGVSISRLNTLDGDDGVMIADLVAESGGLLGMTSTNLPIDDAFHARIDRFFGLAEDRGLDLDLHVDESNDTASTALREIALTALRRGFKGRIQCGHCCSLALQSEAAIAETIRLVAEAGITIIVLPMCNMFLQDRVAGRTPRWRGITPVHEFRAAGVPVSFASDNCRDPFYAYGDNDMLEVWREAVRICQLDTGSASIGDWSGSVATAQAAALNLPGAATIRPGAPADLLVFRARSMNELLCRPHADRVVLRAGRAIDTNLPDYADLDPIFAG
jgi:cytosine deaminase